MVGAARFELATPGPPERQLLSFPCFLFPRRLLFSLRIQHLDEKARKRRRRSWLQFGLQLSGRGDHHRAAMPKFRSAEREVVERDKEPALKSAILAHWPSPPTYGFRDRASPQMQF